MGMISTMMESEATGQRAGISRDSAQGVVYTFPPAGGKTLFKNMPCSYQEPSVNVVDVYGQRQSVPAPTLYFAQDPNVEVNDRIQVTIPRTGEVFYVNVRGEAQSVGRGRIYEVPVERIRAPK